MALDSENSDDTSRLNRDTEHTEKDLFTVDRKQGDFDVTVDHRLLTEEGREAIGKDIEDTKEAGQDVYRAAETYVNSDDMDLFDFGKSVSDNRKLTDLKNDLLSSQEGLDLLNDLKSEDANTSLAAKAAISKLAQEKYGIQPENVNFYNADKTTSTAMADTILRDVKGGVVTDDDHEMHGEINADISEATTKTEILNTVGHETYESITENTTGEQTAAQEDLADAFGNQFEDRVNQAAGGDLDSTTGSNWNSALQNSQMVNQGTQRVNQVANANVDHRMFRYKEAKVMDNIRGRIDSDKSLTNNQKQQAKVQLSALACASVKCAEQVPESDPYYNQLTDLQDAGEKLQADGASLKNMLGEDAEGLFEHDWLDSVNDAVLKHDEGITKGGAIVNVVAGYGGAATSAIGGAAICTGGVTCAAGATLATVGTDAGLEQGRVGLNKLNEDYSSTVGESTLNSASIETHEGDVNPVGDLAIDAAVGAGTLVLETVIAKAGGKALDKVVDVVDQAGSSKKVIRDIDSSVDSRETLTNPSKTEQKTQEASKDMFDTATMPVESSLAKSDFGKYSTAIDNKVTVVDKSEAIPDWVQESFLDSNYRSVVTNEEITVYRVFGGNANAQGAFVTTSPASNKIQAKIDAALLPEWKNSRIYEAEIVIPKGTKLHVGKVAPQTIKSSGTVLDGESDQLLMPQNWPEEWIKNVKNVKP